VKETEEHFHSTPFDTTSPGVSQSKECTPLVETSLRIDAALDILSTAVQVTWLSKPEEANENWAAGSIEHPPRQDNNNTTYE